MASRKNAMKKAVTQAAIQMKMTTMKNAMKKAVTQNAMKKASRKNAMKMTTSKKVATQAAIKKAATQAAMKEEAEAKAAGTAAVLTWRRVRVGGGMEHIYVNLDGDCHCFYNQIFYQWHHGAGWRRMPLEAWMIQKGDKRRFDACLESPTIIDF